MFNVIRQPLFNAESDMGGGQGGNDSASSNPTFTPGWGLPEGQAAGANPLFNEPVATPPVQPETAQVFDFAGRKIEVNDPAMLAALKDVHKDYTALTGTYTQTNQRVKELEQANQTYMNILQNMPVQLQQQGQNANQPTPQNEPTAEDREQMKAEFMEQFYSDPLASIETLLDSMFQQRVQPVIEPITQERQWNEQMQALQQKYPDDFQNMIGPMRDLLQEMPHLAEHGLEGVFQIAKRATPPPQPGPEQLLSDPQFLQQIMSKPEIQKQFLSQYLQEKQGSQQQAPTVMGGQPGGQMPTTPEDRPTDIRSASKAFRQYLGLQN